MKLFLYLLIILHASNAYTQLPTRISITLTTRNKEKILAVIDTVFLKNKLNNTDTFYTNLRSTDTSLIIPYVPIGKYLLSFSKKSYCIESMYITACSKCKNSFQINILNNQPSEECRTLFPIVEMDPSYGYLNKRLKDDFFSNLTDDEKKNLGKSDDFEIKFFVTKEKLISDVFIKPENVPQKIKKIILKGLENLTQWNPSIVNGRYSDGVFRLTKGMLFK